MANNRYYIECPVCKKQQYMGKSLGDGIYNTRAYEGKGLRLIADLATEHLHPNKDLDKAYAEVLDELYTFMWKHLIDCHHDELKGGTLFHIVGEYPEKDED